MKQENKTTKDILKDQSESILFDFWKAYSATKSDKIRDKVIDEYVNKLSQAIKQAENEAHKKGHRRGMLYAMKLIQQDIDEI